MHSPMQSLGESRTHPSTPCSASMECGGRRSILGVSAVLDDLRRDFFKSGGGGEPESGWLESVMAIRKQPGSAFRHPYLLEVLRNLFAFYSQPKQGSGHFNNLVHGRD